MLDLKVLCVLWDGCAQLSHSAIAPSGSSEGACREGANWVDLRVARGGSHCGCGVATVPSGRSR